jgi:uncharacterized protein (DUF58 family)
MGDYLIPFLLVILFLAAFLRQDFLLTLVYLLLGAFVLSRWWSRKALSSLSYTRFYRPRAFLGEEIPVHLEIKNTGFLPVVWLHVRENLPLELAAPKLTAPGVFQQVVSVPPMGDVHFDYSLEGRKRGYYRVGPLNLFSSDLLGASGGLRHEGPTETITVYPKIVPLTRLALPSRSPLGSLRHTQPIFEDPSRPRGKRDYIAGDSLRRVDWKATAATGRLQVKLFEPSIALETAIFLNLNAAEFDLYARFLEPELAIVVAASIAYWIVNQRQAVGLYTNGSDPLAERNSPQPIQARSGRVHLMRVLDVLARVAVAETYPLVSLIRQEIVNLSWGTTMILITGFMDDDLFDALFQARRAGMDAVLILIGQVSNYQYIRQRAEYFGFPLHAIRSERDLDQWRQ